MAQRKNISDFTIKQVQWVCRLKGLFQLFSFINCSFTTKKIIKCNQKIKITNTLSFIQAIENALLLKTITI